MFNAPRPKPAKPQFFIAEAFAKEVPWNTLMFLSKHYQLIGGAKACEIISERFPDANRKKSE